MSASMKDKLKRRKLDALKRGVHRTGHDAVAAVSTHVIGIGKAGAGAIAQMLRGLQPGGPKFFALAIDIGEQDLTPLRALAAELPPDRAEVTCVGLQVASMETLRDGLTQYPSFLRLEYPLAHPQPEFQPWLQSGLDLPERGGKTARAVAKAIYGLTYYAAPRTMELVLRNFAARVDAATPQAVVAVVFGLGGGTGSGIVPDLARHLSNRIFGRRALVVGIGIAPCDGDAPQHTGGDLFAVLNEFDCLGDEGKNVGIVTACGELFRNPFTAGFFMVPQQPVWDSTGDLAATHRRCDQEIATLVVGRHGVNLWEALRLLNWVAAPSTQHSAARTPWGPKWIHMLGFADLPALPGAPRPISIDADLPRKFGLLDGYCPEFIEFRLAAPDEPEAAACGIRLQEAFSPDIAPQVTGGGGEGSVQFILPCVSKTDLGLFYTARDAYDREPARARILDHALLLDQGVLLSEPSTRLAGMAGASLPGSDRWVAVPLDGLRGGQPPPLHRAKSQYSVQQLGHAL